MALKLQTQQTQEYGSLHFLTRNNFVDKKSIIDNTVDNLYAAGVQDITSDSRGKRVTSSTKRAITYKGACRYHVSKSPWVLYR